MRPVALVAVHTHQRLTRLPSSHTQIQLPYSGDAGAGTLKTVVALGAAAAAAVFVLLRKK